MKKIFTLFLLGLILVPSFAAFPSSNPLPKASEIFISIGQSGQKISLQELATIKVKDYEVLAKKKLDFFEKISFKLTQKKLRKSIQSDGRIDAVKAAKFFKPDNESGFHIGGFLLGFFLLPLGVLIAYLMNDDNRENRIKWAWIGLGASVAVALLVVRLILASY